MSSMRKNVARQRVGLAIRARKLARENTTVLIVLAVIVAVGVTSLLTRRVLAAKHQVRVLDCHVAGAVAHHHDDSCYDDEGNLVCSLPERDVHVHDQSCYERRLVCGQDEGAGAHYHDESCYDEWGELICGQEESAGHVHDDSCYADVLVCGQEECAEEHVHGEGCFRVVASSKEAEEFTHPKQNFHGKLRETDDSPELTVDVEAPLGTLPNGSSLEIKRLEGDDARLDLVQAAADKRAEEKTDLVAGRVVKYQAMGLTFRDQEGNEVQPSGDVTIKLTTPLAQAQDQLLIAHVESDAEAQARVEQERAQEQGEQKKEEAENAKPQAELEAHVVDTLTDNQLSQRKLKLEEDQLVFDTAACGKIVVATTSLQHQMVSTDGVTTTITVDASPEAGIPQDAYLDVTKVSSGTEEYDEYLTRTAESMAADRSDVAMAAFFDIHIKDKEGREFQPQAPVDVKIELSEIPDAPNGFAAVHFRKAGDEGQTELDQLTCGGENGTVTFAADSFSVYGIVYTVDFGYEVDGQLYEWSMPGGGSVGLRELVETLHVWEGSHGDVESFLADVQAVTFSDPGLVWVEQVTGRKSAGELLDELGLEPQYTAEVTDEQKAEWAAKEYENDWALLSLKPFTSTEMLTITMGDGTQRLVQVTDTAGEGVAMKVDPETGQSTGEVDTIPNPAGTTIDLIDYWITDALRFSKERAGWPNFPNDWVERYSYGGQTLRGEGVNAGINEDKVFKFNPASDKAVLDGPWSGSEHKLTARAENERNQPTINTYTGDADPRIGLVKRNLDANGYPQLAGEYDLNNAVGVNGETLDYLFDATEHAGKKYYGGVDQLLYVDEDGYYMFDSNTFFADFNGVDANGNETNDMTFTLTDQGARSGDPRGFWPFGEQVFWQGMHMKSQFSMPENGQVRKPNGTYESMTFEFQGDDDTWLYIDGVLVGDGGGIHNKTNIFINYETGAVIVTGTKDTEYDPSAEKYHTGDYTEETTLKALFEAALREQGKNDQDITNYLNEHFDGDTFKDNSYHTFDMFYLERGGGASNLYIRYNLVSTADFTAHKEYAGDGALKRDAFQFELVGLDGQCSYTETYDTATGERTGYTLTPPAAGSAAAEVDACMPKHRNAHGDDTATGLYPGSVANPHYNGNATASLIDGTQVPAQLYATGVSEDGNVNFGMADITEDMHAAYGSDQHPAYRYLVREVIPGDAVNMNGKAYADCTTQERAESQWFTKDRIMYDARTYYMLGAITSWVDGGNTYYGLSKRYFTDDTFTTMRDDVDFINFENRYVDPISLNLVKKSTADSSTLDGAQFRLVGATSEDNPAIWHETEGATPRTATTANGGLASFDNLDAGYYILTETKAPAGYKKPQKKWLVEVYRKDMVELEDETTKPEDQVLPDDNVVRKYSELGARVTELDIDGHPNGSPVEQTVTNKAFTLEDAIKNEPAPPFELTVEKHWGGLDLTDSSDAAAVANSRVVVTLGRYKLADIAGTLDIVKKGVPAGAHMTATYVVRDEGGAEVARMSNGTWAGGDTTVGSLSLAPGTYTVEETIDSDDGRYTATHNDGADNPQQKQIVDEGSETATFTSSYAPKTGSLTITSTLDNQTNPAEAIDTSGVKYQLYDADNNLVETYRLDSDDFTRTGDSWTMTVPNLLIGDYRVVESGWPEDIANVNCIHNNGTTATGTVTETTTPSCDFSTTYTTGHPVRVIVYRVKSNNTGLAEICSKEVQADSIRLDFKAKRGGNVKIGTTQNSDNIASSSQIQWTSDDQGLLQAASVEISIPSGYDNADNPYRVYITTDWDVTDIGGQDDTSITEIVPVFGTIRISQTAVTYDTSSGIDSSYSVDPTPVRYSVYNSENQLVGNQSGYTYNEAMSGISIQNLPAGNYRLHVENWPLDASDTSIKVNHSVSVNGGSSTTATGASYDVPISFSTEDGASCTVGTVYTKQSAEPVTLTLHYGNGSTYSTLVNNSYYEGDFITITFTAKDSWFSSSNFICGKSEQGTDYNDLRGGSNPNFTVANLKVQPANPNATTKTMDVWLKYDGNTDECFSFAINPASTMGAFGITRFGAFAAIRKGMPGVSGLMSVSPGADTANSSDSGDKPTPAEANKKYVVDRSFTTDNTVTLTVANHVANSNIWRDKLSNLPADDGNGNKYYYFIESVSETGLPVGTELTIVKDGEDQMLAFERDDYAEPNHLVARNVVGTTADVSLLKVDADDTTTSVGGATFHLVKVEGQSDSTITAPTVSPMSSGHSVTVDAQGVFNVPEGGVLIESLQPGTYKVVEDTPPDGYVMTGTTEFVFTVNADGTVVDASGAALPMVSNKSTLTVANTAGSALPHSGGRGALAATIAGCLLVVTGAMLLFARRRQLASAVARKH